ncbi:type VI secretion system lipoprotein TssJ [Lysobacter psychrotolerans]|uniref:Type VI secretion system lipoprotein TssJ n=2 Tax=Montanilutibacter psychrotolerans TaxID=1327343 RepID=A0A3M8SU68_9GAMM|nr:type VI secretion system lipoprotein TssJ [Lysobacter psychrotolerans]
MDSPGKVTNCGTQGLRTRRRAAATALLAVLAAVALGGCASGGGVGKAVGKTLEAMGLKAPVAPTPQPVSVPLRLYAGENLNAGTGARPLALVVRVYQLRNMQQFEQTPFDAFLDEERERAALGSDLVRVTEVLLRPGQRHEMIEDVAADARSVGVVALFRTPASSRWRFSFDARQAAKQDGITVGLHACALTTSSVALQTPISGDSHGLAAVNCASTRR